MKVFIRALLCGGILVAGLSGCHKDKPAPAPTPVPTPPPAPVKPPLPPSLPQPVAISPSPWVEQASLKPTTGFFNLRFANAQTGWLLSGFQTLRTDDGGATWKALDLTALHLSTSAFFDLYPVTDQVLYAMGKDKTVTGGGSPLFMYKSTDGGQNWRQMRGNGLENGSISFINEQTGFISSSDGLSKTTDGGQTWRQIFKQPLGNIPQMLTPSLGYIGGGVVFSGISLGTLLKTTDGGETWQDLKWGREAINNLTFLSPLVGLMRNTITHGSGSTYRVSHSLYKTVDGGVSWQLLTDNALAGSYTFISEQEFYCSNTGVQHTRDGGATWVLEYTLPIQLYYQDHFQPVTVMPGGALYTVSDMGVTLKRP